MTIKRAIKELKEQKAALDKHIAKGGEYCKEYAEALGMGITALKKEMPRALIHVDDEQGMCQICKTDNEAHNVYCIQCGQAISKTLTYCISTNCIDCKHHEKSARVCEHYADKVDEIRRIHEEADDDYMR